MKIGSKDTDDGFLDVRVPSVLIAGLVFIFGVVLSADLLVVQLKGGVSLGLSWRPSDQTGDRTNSSQGLLPRLFPLVRLTWDVQ